MDTSTFDKWLEKIPNIWNFALTSFDGEPITIGKLITGLILLAFSYILAGLLSRSFEKRFLGRFELDISLKYTLQRILFYLLMALFTLFVLRLISVPITVFTVVGGALAIGIGFGSQNIVNNFISGLIVMIERPVRIGDLIEVENLVGNVETIGARSTKVKSFDNTHYVVPNSIFLEKIVLNWTLSDSVIRRKVSVGVAYGSNTHKVEELLLKAANTNKNVLSEPEAFVIFNEFGGSSLNFDLYFWCDMGPDVSLIRTSSQIRFEIDRLFRENQIEISFPQLDVHLDSKSPLQIKNVT